MGRIILSRYESGQEKLVVGWDNAQQTFFGQIFNPVPEDNDYPDDWEEVSWYTGYVYGEHRTIESLYIASPNPVRELLTPRAARALITDCRNPSNLLVDMSRPE